MSGSRGTWEDHWEECAKYVLPAYSNSFNAHAMNTPGAKRSQYQYDSTAVTANGRFAAVMESMLTPRSQRWQRVVPSDSYLMKSRAVRLYFEEVTNQLFRYRYAPEANFQGQNHQNYIGMGAFGTGCLFIDKLASAPGLRYKAIHLGQIYFAENHQGVIDRAIRRFPLTARQAYQKWGDKCGPQVKEAAEKKPETEFYFLHCVKPRTDRDAFRMDYKGMDFASYYVDESAKLTIEEGGYSSFPYAISRYTQAPGEIYGRSPAMEALAAIKGLNEMKKTGLKQGHRVVDPILLLADDNILDTFSLRPGSAVVGGMSGEGRPLVGTLPTGNLAANEKMMAMEMQSINDAFLTTLFQILTETPSMTATEVLERTREKGVLLSPTAGRQQSEYLGPMTVREIDLLEMQGLLPPMPPELVEAKGEYLMQYDSPLNRAARAEEAAGFMRTVEMATAVFNVTQDPSVMDRFDFDVAIPEIAELQATPTRWMRSMEAVEAIREGRAQQAQVGQAIEAGPAVAALAKTVAGAPAAR